MRGLDLVPLCRESPERFYKALSLEFARLGHVQAGLGEQPRPPNPPNGGGFIANSTRLTDEKLTRETLVACAMDDLLRCLSKSQRSL